MAHYVTNKDFLKAFVERKLILDDCKLNNKEVPPLSDYIAKCILDICTRLSYKGNFINYSYRNEMVSDAILNCLSVADNFDPEKSSNPFAYFTQVAYFAFLRRIDQEKKQQYIKGKLIAELPLDEILSMEEDSDDVASIQGLRSQFFFNIEEYEQKRDDKKKKYASKKVAPLDEFMVEDVI